MDDKTAFIRVYANLPVGLRSEVVAAFDDIGPITWNAAYVEVSNNTELGKKILTLLKKLEII